jgi:hypothetical protein
MSAVDLQRIGDWLAWLGGGDRDLLAQVPRARARFVQMGLVLLTTATLAVLSMSFALHDGMHTEWYVAIPLGVLWGFVILNLDRFLVLSMGTTRDVGRLALMAAPRLVMAALLAVVISTPLVLRVFSSTIDDQIRTYQRHESQQQSREQASTADQTQADRLQAQIRALQRVEDGHLPDTITNPAVDAARQRADSLQRQATRARTAMDTAREVWQCELYGSACHNGSRRRGPGPIAAAKKSEFDEARSAYLAVNRQLTAAKAIQATAEGKLAKTTHDRLVIAQAAAARELPGLRDQLARLTRRINAEAAADGEANRKDTGILAQLRALSQASHDNPSLQTAHLVVALLFFMIELLPVLVKVLTNLGPPSAYDVLAGLADEQLKDSARIRRVEARQIEEGKSETRIDAERDMRERELDLSKQANARVAGEMTTIMDAALQDWSAQVRSQLGGNGPAHNGHGVNGNGNGNGVNGNGSNGHNNGGSRRAQAKPGSSSQWDGKRRPGDSGEDEDELRTEVRSGYDLPDGEEL